MNVLKHKAIVRVHLTAVSEWRSTSQVSLARDGYPWGNRSVVSSLGDWGRWPEALGSHPDAGRLPWSPLMLQVNHHLHSRGVNQPHFRGCYWGWGVCVSVWSITASTPGACCLRREWAHWMFPSSSSSLPLLPLHVLQGREHFSISENLYKLIYSCLISYTNKAIYGCNLTSSVFPRLAYSFALELEW